MRGYRLTTLGKVVLFSLLFLFTLSTAYTVKAFKYKKGNNSLDITSNNTAPITQTNQIRVIKEIDVPYANKIIISPEIYINKLKNTKLTIYFEADDDLIKEQYYDALDMIANIADILKDSSIKIEGNCATVHENTIDNRNNVISYNLSLSRAKSVSNYLKEKGMEPNRIIVIGNGSNKPVKPNTSEEERMYNRRVEISFNP